MNMYSDYFYFKDYWPEITEQSILDPHNKWEDTHPHKTFVDILKATERMLARSTNSDKKGIWIEGAYGTGKTRVAWTLKNLLDCSDDALKAYFAEYQELQREPDLRDRLLAHKQGKIITTCRFSSGGIIGDRALICAIYDSVSEALRSAGVPFNGANTLRGRVAAWLSDEINKELFNKIIDLPKYRGLGSFAGRSADDIIAKLNSPNNERVDDLMNDIFMLADARGIRAFSIDMDGLIAWLTEVIEQNALKAIVFVWDEFSDYLKNNKYALSEFQKLLHLAETKPFYMIIVTHMSGSILPTGKDGANISDRFMKNGEKRVGIIELPDSIAFDLINNALKFKKCPKDTWDGLADTLNGNMSISREAVRKSVWKDSNEGDDVIKGMLPLHPLAALLLKNISSLFASNQRSMFNFIQHNDDKNLQAFQWFINTHSPQSGDILSIDYLWNFFYVKGTDEYGRGEGRSNLDTIIRSILDTFPRNEDRLLDEEKRVLKTILMMQAISQKLGNDVPLFQTTDQNIGYAFEGTDLDNRAVNLAKKLVRDGILYEQPIGGGKIQYAAAAVSGDQAQIDVIKKRIRSEEKTISLVSTGGLSSAISLTAALNFRYDIKLVTIENFTATINKITNDPSIYRICAVMSFARNDEEQNKIRELIKNAMKNDGYTDLVFIDASSTVLGGERFEQWVECAANDEYWRAKDSKLADEMSRKANAILEDWKMDIANGSFTVYSVYAKTGELCRAVSSTITVLLNILIQRYPLSFDNADKVTRQMFDVTAFLSGAKYGITQTYGGMFLQSFIIPLMQDTWQKEKYWESFPTLPLSKLKLKIDDLIKASFVRDGRISIGDIFDELMKQGFMPCNLYAFLTGFLLKEYATDTYRYSDDQTGDKMGIEKMAEIIGECFKHKYTPIRNYKDKYIEIMTKEQMAFVDFAKIVFGIADNMVVEYMAVSIRSKLKELGFPVWCFKEIDTYGLESFIDKLAAIANPDNSGENVSNIATTLGKMSLQTPTAAHNLAALLTRENAKKAMYDFLSVFENGNVLNLANEINVQDVLRDVKHQFGSGEALWLWDQETGEEELRKLLTDYKIIAASNRINTAKTSSLSACVVEWHERTKSITIPCSALLTKLPHLKEIFMILRDIAGTEELVYEKRALFLAELENNGKAFADFFATRTDVFKDIYSYHLTGFNEDEVKTLYFRLPMTSFTLEMSDFEKIVVAEVEKIRGELEKYKLHWLWEDKTVSRTPRDWSLKNKTPILSLVPIAQQNDARRVFDVINRANPEDNDVKFALDFLQKKAAFLSDLSDKAKVDSAFMLDIVERFAAVLPNADEVRSHLEAVVPLDHYDWHANSAVRGEVEKFAQARYNQSVIDRVLEKIENMDDRKAKEYLKRLIKNDMHVGIVILSEGGNEA